jgi:hypothetical protein
MSFLVGFVLQRHFSSELPMRLKHLGSGVCQQRHRLAMSRKRGSAAGHGFEFAVAARSHLAERQRVSVARKICV